MSSSSSENQDSINNNQAPQTQEQEELNKTNRNPITSDELQKKLRDIASDKEKSARFQEQLAIKFRTEMQNYKYTPPDEFKDHPSLQPTDVDANLQQAPTQPNTKLGETKLTNEQVINAVTPEANNPTIADNTTTTADNTTVSDVQKKQEQQAQEAANTQQNPSQSVKG
jgi:hypothetical protein